MDKVPTRQLIIEAVLDCIEKYGIDKLTTRKIAEEAGTNIASINYHFRTKDDLVAEALSMSINHMMEDVFAAIDNRQQPFREILTEVFFYLIDGGFRFPGITTAHLYNAVTQNHYDSPGAVAINKVFDRLAARATEEYPHKDPDEVHFLLSQVVSSILFTMLVPGFFPVAGQFRLTSSENCQRLAQRYAAVFFQSV